MLKKILPWILIILGCVLIATALYERFETVYYQNKLISEYEKEVEQFDEKREKTPDNKESFHAASDKVSIKELPAIISNPDDNGSSKPSERKIPELIGILKIPKLDLKVAIGEGSDNDSMRYTVGHFTQTAKPGRQGNFAVIGHRSYRYGQFFNRLDEIKEGDLIVVESAKHTYTYKVTEAFVVKPEDTWVLDETNNATITLITCTPIRIATHRLIIRGELEKSN
jgi:sortase A